MQRQVADLLTLVRENTGKRIDLRSATSDECGRKVLKLCCEPEGSAGVASAVRKNLPYARVSRTVSYLDGKSEIEIEFPTKRELSSRAKKSAARKVLANLLLAAAFASLFLSATLYCLEVANK